MIHGPKHRTPVESWTQTWLLLSLESSHQHGLGLQCQSPQWQCDPWAPTWLPLFAQNPGIYTEFDVS